MLYPPVSGALEQYEAGLSSWYSPQELAAVYRFGSLPEMMVARSKEWIFYNAANLLWQRTALAAMLTGYWIGRHQWHLRYKLYFSQIRRVLPWMVLIVAAFTTFVVAGGQRWLPAPVFFLVYTFFIPFTIMTYVLALLWVYHLPYLPWIRNAVTRLGRMSLSHYFFQSTAGVLLFTGLGARLYGQTGPLANWLIAIGIYITQLLLCGWYLKYYRTGPLEYLWRKWSGS